MMAPAEAHESRVRFTDPSGDATVDVWSTKKATLHRQSHLHRVRFQVRAYVGPDWYVTVFVDSRRGPKADFKLWAFEDLGTRDCGGRRLFHEEIPLRCDRVLIGVSAEGRLWWSIRRRVLDPDKRIRWRIQTHYPGDAGDDNDDRAPDIGWYP